MGWSAEADGNRTRQTGRAGLYGFEDQNTKSKAFRIMLFPQLEATITQLPSSKSSTLVQAVQSCSVTTAVTKKPAPTCYDFPHDGASIADT